MGSMKEREVLKSLPIIGDLEEKEQELYGKEIAPFLPSRIVDFHAHTGLRENFSEVTEKRRAENIGLAIAYYLPIERLFSTYENIFRGKTVETVVCPFPFRECKAAEANSYVSRNIIKHDRVEGLFLADSTSAEEEMRTLVLKRGFKGVKPYPDRLSGKAWNDIEVKDYVSTAMLRIADQYRLPIFLHVPKEARLASQETLREIREISTDFPNITIVLAHVGRLHCPPLIQTGIDGVVGLQNVYFETSLATNPDVFRYALEKFSPERFIFGTDLPASLIRGRIICSGERRIWAVKGDYPWVRPEDRKLYEKDVETLIPMVYENILAFKEVREELDLGKNDVNKVFYENAKRILDQTDIPVIK